MGSCSSGAAGLNDAKGAYLLTLRVTDALELERPLSGCWLLKPGWYLYAGSAWGSGGIKARVGRHFRKDKKPHWHIDHLTLQAANITALAVPDGKECDLVAELLGTGHFRIAVPGFGSSDCRRCKGHLLTLVGDSKSAAIASGISVVE